MCVYASMSTWGHVATTQKGAVSTAVTSKTEAIGQVKQSQPRLHQPNLILGAHLHFPQDGWEWGCSSGISPLVTLRHQCQGHWEETGSWGSTKVWRKETRGNIPNQSRAQLLSTETRAEPVAVYKLHLRGNCILSNVQSTAMHVSQCADMTWTTSWSTHIAICELRITKFELNGLLHYATQRERFSTP